MRGLVGAILVRLGMRSHSQRFVRMTFEDGSTFLAGPMDHFTAEAYLVQRVNAHPYLRGKRVVSARIIGGD